MGLEGAIGIPFFPEEIGVSNLQDVNTLVGQRFEKRYYGPMPFMQTWCILLPVHRLIYGVWAPWQLLFFWKIW